MKHYRVVITPFAADNIREAHAWLKTENLPHAARWLQGIKKAILALSSMPESHPLAPESDVLDGEIRQCLFGRGTPWRIFFTIEETTVYVLHVRHGRRSDWQG
ncbi:MAG: type II toxin-antitoxin system RelE/ParE family toxin [Magnetococcales bacterium]|nr:type II toxin-antitoxin system RelE/ParE family toxin [Magnetococcales bacterium]MBF0116273.1 type II toxin-antitoxin system RelE/ParE family toxin [Magnetococcales bacterium]